MRLLFGGYLCLKRCIVIARVTEIAEQHNLQLQIPRFAIVPSFCDWRFYNIPTNLRM